MKNSNKFIVTAGVISAGMLAAVASADFGTLSYPSGAGSNQIPFQWPGSGQFDNTNFVYTNTNIGTPGAAEWLTIGLRGNAYYGAPNTTPAYVGNNTFQADAGSSLWAPAPGDDTPPGYSNAPRWGFSWSISVNGSREAPATDGLFWSLRIVGPGTTGNWGTTQFGGAVDSAAALNAWQLGFNYFPLSSAQSGYPVGLWDGLTFNPNTLGDYQFTIAVRDGSYNGAIVGQTSMVVSVVPAPGALALLGVAGLAGGRRRRA
jgi:MYXO-CTERM domain-containing protein